MTVMLCLFIWFLESKRESEMIGLSCICINRAPILSSLSDRSNPDTNPQVRRIKTGIPLQPPAGKQQKEKKPSVAEIERAIGAGIFRDRDINRQDYGSSNREKTLFDSILSNSIGRKEGDVEKKLRETGEWIIDQTEAPSRSTGGVLMDPSIVDGIVSCGFWGHKATIHLLIS
ncbi:hypothetical protein Ccrd_016229 [Cynara cardunculus var. scolymus]|uniref:Uncharacterized protein n=1 Tax=Cynara cardunculus var. scolymus TaxID=59895 RepID=A0A103YAC9_CYNCS|nr:hypothetical protein Ccrd_016229 [Cynara cardunculus var. scolymus]